MGRSLGCARDFGARLRRRASASSSILLAATKVMSTQTIELEGFEIELASELYCDRGGDHRELVDRARMDRRRLGHNIDESAVLCVRCMKAIPLKA
jgi:hypothetical protein